MYENVGIRRYQETNLGTMGKEKMIVMLYETLVLNMDSAKRALAEADQLTMVKHINQAQRIITELRGALDHAVGGEIARNLEALYDYLFHENLAVLVDKDPSHLENNRTVLIPLLDAWRRIPPGTAENSVREQTANGTAVQSSGQPEEIGADPASEHSGPDTGPDGSNHDRHAAEPRKLIDATVPVGHPDSPVQSAEGMLLVSA